MAEPGMFRRKKLKTERSEVRNRIVKRGFVDWRKANWVQPDGLKFRVKEKIEKLKKSLLDNGFLSAMIACELKRKVYILDAHHRQLALMELESEGRKVPDRMPVDFIDVKDIDEAKQIVLILSSKYADFHDDALAEYIESITMSDGQFDQLLSTVELPGIDIDKLMADAIPPEDFTEVDETVKTEHECPSCGYKWSGGKKK